MHSLQLTDDITAHFHGDFSGDVTFDLSGEASQNAEYCNEVRIPFEALEKIVLEKYKRDTISQLEQMDDEQLRNLFGRAW